MMVDFHGHQGARRDREHANPRRANSAPVGGDTHNSPSDSNQLLSSQGSSVQPTGGLEVEEVASKMVIAPDGNEFFPFEAANKISDIIMARYDKPWLGWKEIPTEHRVIWYQEFKKQCRWAEVDHLDIVRVWKLKSAQIVRKSLGDIRSGRAEGIWLERNILIALKQRWKTNPHLKTSSKLNKKNAIANKKVKEESLSQGEKVDRPTLFFEASAGNNRKDRSFGFGRDSQSNTVEVELLKNRLQQLEDQNQRLQNEMVEIRSLFQNFVSKLRH